jgi:hypothetical protein
VSGPFSAAVEPKPEEEPQSANTLFEADFGGAQNEIAYNDETVELSYF